MKQLPFEPRFYCPALGAGDEVDIDGTEHQHMTKVLRLKQGASVTLFDGAGIEYDATISEIGRNATRLTIGARQVVDRELSFELTMGVALPKGDRQQWLVEKCVELGVTRLTPLIAIRGVAQPKDKALQRLERWIISASKQCRRNRLMEVTSAETMEQFVPGASRGHFLLAHPDPNAPALAHAINGIASKDSVTVAIGPEGGFTEEEVATAKAAGWQVVTLGTAFFALKRPQSPLLRVSSWEERHEIPIR